MSSADEIVEIRGLARDFAAAELRPHAERWDAERSLDDDVTSKVAELGFFGMLVAENQGGMGFTLGAWTAALEQLAWGEAGAALMVAQSVIAADVIARFGGAAQRDTVEALAAGASVACIAAAGDERVEASRAGDGWTLNGTRPWVTNAMRADLALVLAHDGDGLAFFVVPRSAGWTVGEPAATMGLRSVGVASITLDGVTVPAEARLGWSGGDAHDAMDPLGCLSVAAIAVGIAQAALDHAVQYANVREQFGRSIRSFEGIQVKLAEMATRTAAARALIERAAAATDDRAAAAMAKLAAGSCAMDVTTDAVQVFGGYGYMRDYPVEKLMRDAKAMEMLHGTSELQRLRIAESLYAE